MERHRNAHFSLNVFPQVVIVPPFGSTQGLTTENERAKEASTASGRGENSVEGRKGTPIEKAYHWQLVFV